MSKTAVPETETETPVVWHTTEDVAKRYRTAAGTVRYWRHIGYGPKSVKNGRRVLYSDSALKAFDAWLLAQADGAA